MSPNFVEQWFKAYFENRGCKPFPWKRLDLGRATPFQRKVYRVLWKIPFGKTLSYREVAQAIGKPKAARAVGQAVGKNPFPILIPCHRVIASDGSIGGFSCGVGIKRKLLKHEGITLEGRSL